MANTTTAGTIHVDTLGLLYSGRVKVTYIVLTSDTATTVTLLDGVAGTAPLKLTLKNASTSDSKVFDFSRAPIVFNSGIYCDAITAGATIMLITSTAGSTV